MTAVEPATAGLGPGDSYREVYESRMAAKILAEFCHERVIRPLELTHGEYLVLSDDGQTEYLFAAQRLSLDSWVIDESSMRRIRAHVTGPVDPVGLIIDLHAALGIQAAALPEYLEEFVNTLMIGVSRQDDRRISAGELAHADFQTIERTMTEGHPCLVANAGRLGFSADDIDAYAPESSSGFRLIWLAVTRTSCDFVSMPGIDREQLLRDEIGPEQIDAFDATLRGLGHDPGDYWYLPVHPWQWTEKVARLYAQDLANRSIIRLDAATDCYQPQQSIRTVFNLDRPQRHYVKLALSIVNMGFTRGMSADYMRTTPLINEWVRQRVSGDPYLESIGFQMLFEVAAIGYRSADYASITEPGSEYRKILSALWRNSPVPHTDDDEQLTTMAALLHVDHLGTPLVAAFIERSGQTAADWVRQYLRTYLHPITYLLYAYELKFSPHGENLILVLDNGIPVRAFLKDIGEEVSVLGDSEGLDGDCRRAVTVEPEEIRNLGVLSDIFDDFLRPLAAILHGHDILDDHDFWTLVAHSIIDLQDRHPQLADRFERWDLFTPTFGAIHMNRLQITNNRRMVDIEDSYASMIDSEHTLRNPIAEHRPDRVAR